jgi:hypothetical protein
MNVRLCQTLVDPREIFVPSSTGAGVHSVTPSTVWNDAICSCKGFEFRGTCKHVVDLDSSTCDYVIPEPDEGWATKLDDEECPKCGSLLVEMVLEPEFDDYVCKQCGKKGCAGPPGYDKNCDGSSRMRDSMG